MVREVRGMGREGDGIEIDVLLVDEGARAVVLAWVEDMVV